MVQKELELADPSVFFWASLIVVVVPLPHIPPFVNRVTNYRGHMAITCLLHSRRVVSSPHVNRLHRTDWPFYSVSLTHTHTHGFYLRQSVFIVRHGFESERVLQCEACVGVMCAVWAGMVLQHSGVVTYKKQV